MEKKWIYILLGILVFGVVLFAVFLPGKEETPKEDLLGIDYTKEGHEVSLKYDTENPVVAMYVKNYGSIVMELYPDVAPNTVNNMISLIEEGFYDQNSFHRLMPGFVLQGGDKEGTGMGGPGYHIKGEFKSNGYQNDLSHEKWVVSMARSANGYDTAGSQFFICLEDAKFLDGDYTTFGRVIDGFDHIEQIAKKEKIADTESGKLQKNLVIEKTVMDLKGKTYPKVEKIEE